MDDDLRRTAEEHFNRGNKFDEDGYRERAIAEWQQVIDINPEHAGAHFNLGIAYAEDDDNPRAIEQLRETIRLDPFDTEARRVLAEIYLDEDRFDDAVNQLRQALNIAPGDDEAARLLAQAYIDHKRWDEATGALESGAMTEQDADLWFTLGQAYEREQRIDDAILAYRRALIAQPAFGDAMNALARFHAPAEDES